MQLADFALCIVLQKKKLLLQSNKTWQFLVVCLCAQLSARLFCPFLPFALIQPIIWFWFGCSAQVYLEHFCLFLLEMFLISNVKCKCAFFRKKSNKKNCIMQSLRRYEITVFVSVYVFFMYAIIFKTKMLSKLLFRRLKCFILYNLWLFI